MKKITLLIFLVLSCINITYSQSSWVWQNPLPQGNTLKDCFFINPSTGYLVGNIGVYIRTTNSGSTWETAYLKTVKNLNAITFIDSNTGFIVGDSSKIFKTINGGLNWNRINYNGDYRFVDIDFYSANFGITVGSNLILKSSDSGQNWINILSLSSSYFLENISFLDSNNIFVVGRKYNGGYVSVILKSSNGGNNWVESNLPASSLFSITIVSHDNIICVGQNSIFKSTDQGISWINRIKFVFATIKDVEFFDFDNGIAIGSDGNGKILRTSNGGDSWYNVLTNGFDPYSINHTSLSDGFIVGENGSILKTTNAGSSWLLLPTGLQSYGSFNKVQLINENTGFICGIGYDNPVYQGGSILKTSNGGETWISQRCFDYSYVNLTDLFFISVNTGFITGEGAAFVMKTTNGGNNWNCNVIGPWDLNAIWFSDSLNGTAVGDYGRIYRTITLVRVGLVNIVTMQFT